MDEEKNNNYVFASERVLPDGSGGVTLCPTLLTEDELIRLLRILEISKARDFHNVVAHLKRHHGLPCVHVCRQPLYPLEAVIQLVKERMRKEMMR